MRTNSKKRKNIIIGILMVLVVITIGYSVLSSRLTINGTSSITSDFKVVVTNIEFSTETSRYASNVDFSGIGSTNVTFTANLEKPDAFADYQVTVENIGKIDAYVKDIVINNPDDQNFKVYYSSDIGTGDKIPAGESLTFTIGIWWDKAATTIPDENITFSSNIEFSQDSTYIGLPATTLGGAIEKQLSLNDSYSYLNGNYLMNEQVGNYVWFDGFLWRIIGINADKSVRMITVETISAIPFSDNNLFNDYDNSYVNDWLNNYFYPKLKNKDYIVSTNWCSEATTDNKSSRTSCNSNLSTVSKPVGLISLDEYNLSRTSFSFGPQMAYTLTPYNETKNWKIDPTGFSAIFAGIRPVINVLNSINISSGKGTLTDPYIIGNLTDTTGTLKDNSSVGEYVTYAGRNYRVVETSSSGTKLILDGYYDSNDDGVVDASDKMAYGTNCTLCTTINEDSFINWLSNNNEIEKAKLVSTTWYRGDYWTDDNYKTNVESTANPYVGSVGLIKVGEMLSGQSETILSKNHTVVNDNNNAQYYWTATPYSASFAWNVYSDGTAGKNFVSSANGVRPVINIGPNVQIASGNGTFNSPYQI